MSARDMATASAPENRGLIHQLVERWAPMLQGLPTETPRQRHVVAQLAMQYENQARYLRGMTEEVRAANVGPYLKTIFPLLRRSVPNSILNEIASVQALATPSGGIFYYDVVYQTTKGATTKGNVFPRDFDSDYTSEDVNGEILVTGNGVDYGGAGAAFSLTLGFAPVRPLSSTQGYKVVIREINATTGATVQECIDNGSGIFTGDYAAGTINYDNGAIQGFKFTLAVTNGNPVKAWYSFNGELSTSMPQVGFDVKSATVETRARRAKIVLSQESIEDLKALHGLDAESELLANIAAQFTLEIDRTGINAMVLASTSTTATFDRIPPSGIAEMDHLRAILTTMSSVSGAIHRKTLRRPANFSVTSPDVMALFEQFSSHADFRGVWSDGQSPMTSTIPTGSAMPTEAPGQFGIYRAGLLKNRWSMYEDPFFSRDMMLMGLRGDSYLDAGLVYSPYIPVQMTQGLFDPNSTSLVRAIRTRYAMKIVRDSYYGQVRILNL